MFVTFSFIKLQCGKASEEAFYLSLVTIECLDLILYWSIGIILGPFLSYWWYFCHHAAQLRLKSFLSPLKLFSNLPLVLWIFFYFLGELSTLKKLAALFLYLFPLNSYGDMLPILSANVWLFYICSLVPIMLISFHYFI